jgi:hypothetical protein
MRRALPINRKLLIVLHLPLHQIQVAAMVAEAAVAEVVAVAVVARLGHNNITYYYIYRFHL